MYRVIVAVEHVDFARLHDGLDGREVADGSIAFVHGFYRRLCRRRGCGLWCGLGHVVALWLYGEIHSLPQDLATTLLVAALETFP